MPEQYTITGTVILDDCSDSNGIKVQAFDRDLPSLERRTGLEPLLLGEVIADAEGRFEISYTLEQFQGGEGIPQFRRLQAKNADLSFRVFDRSGPELTIRKIDALDQTLGPDQIFFNVPTLLENVRIFVEAPLAAGNSEYEQLIALITPVVEELPLAELTDEDIAFLVDELGLKEQLENQQHLEWLRRSALLAQASNLPIEAFYGWGRVGVIEELPDLLAKPLADLPNVLIKLATRSDEKLLDALINAITQEIIPTSFRECIEDVVRQLTRHYQVLHQLRAQLLDADTEQALAGFNVITFDRTTAEENLGLDVTDNQGNFIFSFYVSADLAQDAPARKFAFKIQSPSGEDFPEVGVVDVNPNQPEDIVVIRLNVPKSQTPALQEQLQQVQIDAPELIAFFTNSGINTFADIRLKGGIRRLSDLPLLAPEIKGKLEALVDLDRLSLKVVVSSVLIEKTYDSVLAIADAPFSEFVNAVKDAHDELTEFEAMKLHVMASAQTNFLTNLLVEMAANQANGFTL